MKKTTPKILGFLTIHYSGDYLREALISVIDHVDTMLVVHSQKPSHGYKTDLRCPDLRQDIYQICTDVCGNKLIWQQEESFPSEAHHRDVKYRWANGYDIIITVDADEIMLDIPRAIDYALSNPERHFGINKYHNFFRSFEWYCSDGFRPCRIEVMNRDNQMQNLECPMTILHFSCAQRREIMEYKYKSFGHASEIRPNYLEEVFYKWYPGSDIRWLHPVSLQIWGEALPFNKELMPDYLHDHPNFSKSIIP